MNVIDWILIASVVVFALAGWHRGFVAGLLSFIGFLGGGLIAAFLLPELLDRTVSVDWLRVVLLGVGVLVFALLGQFGMSFLGERLRSTMTWQPVRVVDNVAGAALNVLALAVVVWIMASALAYLPVALVSEQVTQSRVLVALDSIVPTPARNAFGDLRDLVATTEVPRIFSGLAIYYMTRNRLLLARRWGHLAPASVAAVTWGGRQLVKSRSAGTAAKVTLAIGAGLWHGAVGRRGPAPPALARLLR